MAVPRHSAAYSTAVPELTRHRDIKLNFRLRLQRSYGALASHGRTLPLVRVTQLAKPSRQYTRRGGFDWTVGLSREFHLKRQPDREALDLMEMRRQLTALRSQHSDNLAIASLLNRFLVKVAFLSEPKDRDHKQYLRSEFAQTLKKVEAIISRKRAPKRPALTKPSK
ncbi:hypothetical protein [Bradyrhizobium zhanjiangense]|uniref:hypothetical protein n=1 Tax=Bradyrhizobium zhanjiangense TaxID=1325107 RepID=UPI001FE0E7E4|nr:hypothetical protein [Bradyrhizobium zhanjiangense]